MSANATYLVVLCLGLLHLSSAEIPSAAKCAAIKVSEREDCGEVTAAGCQAKGCCYAEKDFWFGCYYANVTSSAQKAPICQNVVALDGWHADGTYTERPEHLAALPNAANERDCLRSCRDLGSDKCRMVTFNYNTRQCGGFSAKAIPSFQRDVAWTILACTDKQVRIAAQHQGLALVGADMKAAIGSRYPVEMVGHANVCQNLCRVHPQCNAAVFNKALSVCWLKRAGALTTVADPIKNFVSYLS